MFAHVIRKFFSQGNFNLPRACWSTFENVKDVNEKTFIRVLDDHFFRKVNNLVTPLFRRVERFSITVGLNLMDYACLISSKESLTAILTAIG